MIKRFSLLLLLLSMNKACFAQQAVWIDVRSSIEHFINHIDGDLHIPHSKILQQILTQIPDKKTPIKLYCQSGVRSGKALTVLKQEGYTDVQNMGGINDVRESRSIGSVNQ